MKYRREIAPHWNYLGLQLLQEKYVNKLNIIQKNYPSDIERCCAEMLQHWLDVDTKASWNKLVDALEKTGQNALAREIKEDICKGIYFHYVESMYVRALDSCLQL